MAPSSPKIQNDRMTLVGINLRPRIGVTKGERRQPQSCEADVTLWGDFTAAAASDALDQAIDYSEVLKTILETAHSEEFNLVETLAYGLAKRVLEAYPAERVGVRVRKRPSTIREKVKCIEVEMIVG